VGGIKRLEDTSDDESHDSDFGNHFRAEQLTVREFLKEAFPGQWIVRGSAYRFATVMASTQSELTTPGNSHW
jgi:hypothetical protein